MNESGDGAGFQVFAGWIKEQSTVIVCCYAYAGLIKCLIARFSILMPPPNSNPVPLYMD